MHGATGLLIKLGIRLVVFTLVFWLVAKKHPKVVIRHVWAMPLVALVFAILNTALYWMLAPIAKLATLGMLSIAMPFLINGALLYATVRFFAWPKLLGTTTDPKTGKAAPARKPLIAIEGVLAGVWLVAALALAHGALWLALDR